MDDNLSKPTSTAPPIDSLASRLRRGLELPKTTQLIVLLVFVAMAGRLFRLTYRYAVNIFFWDQWVFHNADLFQKHSLWQMFRWQYGPHRLGLGPLLSILIEPHFHWNSRSESFLACSIVTVAAATGLWLAKRLFGDISLWDMAIPIILLSASQYESLFITSNPAHGPLPLLLITLYCLAWTIPDFGIRCVAVLTLNFISIYTGFALFVGFLTPLLLCADYWANLRREPGRSLPVAAAIVISLGSISSFFYGYTFQPAVNCFSIRLDRPFQYLWYASLMFANFWIKGVGVFARLIGFAVMLCLMWTTFSAGRRIFQSDPAWTKHTVAATLAAFSLLFSANAAVGRLCLGLESAQQSRYMGYLAIGVFGSYLHLLSIPDQKLRRSCLVIALAVVIATIPIRVQDRELMRYFSTLKQSWRTCYLAVGSIPACDKLAESDIEPEPQQILQQKLDYLRNTHQNLFSDSH